MFSSLPAAGWRTQFFHLIFTQPMGSNIFGPSICIGHIGKCNIREGVFHSSVHSIEVIKNKRGFDAFEHSALHITLGINLMECMHGFATIIGSRLDGSIWAVLIPRLQQLCGYAVSAIPHPCSTV